MLMREKINEKIENKTVGNDVAGQWLSLMIGSVPANYSLILYTGPVQFFELLMVRM